MRRTILDRDRMRMMREMISGFKRTTAIELQRELRQGEPRFGTITKEMGGILRNRPKQPLNDPEYD